MITSVILAPDRETLTSWRVEAIDDKDGGVEQAVFHGPRAMARAISYAVLTYPHEGAQAVLNSVVGGKS